MSALLRSKPFRLATAALLALALAAGAAPAATITIVNLDGAGEGFNDPTVVAPVGGNSGTTIGAQRLFVFQHAANIWGGILLSDVTILVNAKFDPLSCTATSGVLGSAGPVSVFRDFTGAPFSSTWYHVALANKLAGVDLSGSSDITATFNSGIGGASCLPSGWYYGIDGNEGSQIELLPVVLHELGHGLGFSTVTSGTSGAYLGGFPSVYDRFLLDLNNGLHWNEMSDAQRVASAINCRKLIWDGPNSTAHAGDFLGSRPLLKVNAPGGIAGEYEVGLATFGAALTTTGITGDVVLADDGVGTTSDGCEALINAGAVSGKIAIIDRGTCTFIVKVKNAQNAGAIAVIIADNVAGCPPAGLSGTDATITIPSMRVTQSDGALLKANIASGLNVTLKVDATRLAGTDPLGRVMAYTPNPFQSGSSVSHWDTSAEPSLLMEPSITSTLSSSVDLTRHHFTDIGWFQGVLAAGPAAVPAARLGSSYPNPAPAGATIDYALDREEVVELAVYDLRGRLVNRLVQGRVQAGSHSVTWDGRDAAGRAMPTGIYLYRLRTPSVQESRPLALVR